MPGHAGVLFIHKRIVQQARQLGTQIHGVPNDASADFSGDRDVDAPLRVRFGGSGACDAGQMGTNAAKC